MEPSISSVGSGKIRPFPRRLRGRGHIGRTRGDPFGLAARESTLFRVSCSHKRGRRRTGNIDMDGVGVLCHNDLRGMNSCHVEMYAVWRVTCLQN